MSGFFITFEGTEGSGKSTQLKLLTERLEAEGCQVVTLREPGGTDSGEEIRQLLKHGPNTLTAETELLLMNASRAQLVREIIRPALAEGAVVLCDRFYDSTTAYQGYGRQLDLGLVASVITIAVGDTRPDLTLLLQIPASISIKRQHDRGGTDRFESADDTFFKRVDQGYEAIAAAEPERIIPINGIQSMEAIAKTIGEIVSELVSKGR